MNLLAIDTSLGLASVAVLKGNEVVAFSLEAERTKQAEKLFEHIEKCLNEAEITYKNLDYISAAIGPGSFTGVRIGMAAAIGISIGLNDKNNVKNVAVTTLEAMANNASNLVASGDFCCLIDAGRKQFYAQKFTFDNSKLKSESEAQAINYNDLSTYIANCANIYCNKTMDFLPNSTKIIDINARDIALCAKQKIIDETVDFNQFSPLYIRKPDAVIGNKYKYLNKGNNQ